MGPEGYARLRRIFHAALDLEPADRPRLVAAEAGDDPALSARLLELLAAHEAEGHWLEGDVLTHAATLLEPFDTAPAGTRLGSYRVVRELGRGGMGAVYLARHEDESIAQQVAIKLIKRGMDSEEILRRFFVERRILSGLHHPNIARLYDGGTSADGRPYFVMEAIEGSTLTQFAERRQLDVPARLQLLLPVIDAVSYAHQNLVVHRDLKPANVLVGEDGVPKLLDFGIAKWLSPELAGTAPTVLEMRPRTPDYASPEQLSGGAITTATDVYGLGLLLSELLTGLNPLLLPDGLNAAGEVRPPSQQLLDHDGGERVTRKRLARQLRGDLDIMVMKAMAKEPRERYGSARELAEDLERHLEHRPIRARRPTLWIRLRSGIRRHRLVSAAAAAVVVLALAASHQALEAARQRDRVQEQQERTQALADFLINLFDIADPQRSLGRLISARDLLDEGTRQIAAADGRPLATEPEIRGDLLHTIGRVYRNLGLEPEARRTLEAALELRRQSRSDLAGADQAATEIELGHLDRLAARYTDSERHYRRALELQSSAAPPSPGVAEAINGLGLTLRANGRGAEGEALLAQALELRRGVVERQPSDSARLALAQSLGNLAAVALDAQKAEEADRLLTEAWQLEEPLMVVGGDHPRRAVQLANLAALLYRNGDFLSAADRLSQTVAIRRRVLPASHPDLAVALSSFASLELELGRYEEAVAAASEAVEILQAVGPSADLAHALLALGNGQRERGDLGTAESALGRSRELYQQLLGEEDFFTANALHSQAWLAWDRGAFAQSRALAELALNRRTAVFGHRHAAVASSKALLATLAAETGDREAAEALEREALALRLELLPEDHPARASSWTSLGRLLLAEGRAAEAEPILAKALILRERRLPAGHPALAVTRGALGEALCVLGQRGSGQALTEQAWRDLVAARGTGHRESLEAARRKARCR